MRYVPARRSSSSSSSSIIYAKFRGTRSDKHDDRSTWMHSRSHHSLEEEEEEEEGLEITRYRRAVNIYRNIPPFSRGWVLIFFASPLVPTRRSKEKREKERERVERYTTPAGKYELLNLDKGSRLNDV